ncbi:type II toxin-antitoxin system RelB/DinJ family antitoxin [Aquibacillus sp. 3ASR75-11]|uniref:Type II toxin-antitoxin system RelB/DinJ family antitoxin n=1 Tax=Terrihalobacillus insolitus TaxID=2950438 RepID=A0A9X3WZX3_9BACI|nr:type II toxin-antitoxin system RelB/DinJ family antitoxin [Terrihalobacillus insolitus]MDC3415267.1 type II toxin-antitoxin system RelB/DinJ family antitoxin [Terrihalobacillus insolitus]MDC3426364.1 type II toxin-antitoxin system RelB/DinJ family antitoxin [Terrihalobacillus insolitus]
MAKTTNLYVRLEPELKEQAEAVLGQLGIPLSNAVNIFLKQVVMQRGIPFDVKIPATKPVGASSLTEEELDAELKKGYVDYVQEDTKPAMKVFSDIRRDYGV